MLPSGFLDRVPVARFNTVSRPAVFLNPGVDPHRLLGQFDVPRANVIHDMNMPLPDALKEQYDLVVDGGTLEHVFFFPTASLRTR